MPFQKRNIESLVFAKPAKTESLVNKEVVMKKDGKDVERCQDCKYYSRKSRKCGFYDKYTARKNTCQDWEVKK